MAKYYFDKENFYNYTWDEFIEHLKEGREIFMQFEEKRLDVLPVDGFSIIYDNNKRSFISRHGILEYKIDGVNKLEDIWNKVILVDVF